MMSPYRDPTGISIYLAITKQQDERNFGAHPDVCLGDRCSVSATDSDRRQTPIRMGRRDTAVMTHVVMTRVVMSLQ